MKNKLYILAFFILLPIVILASWSIVLQNAQMTPFVTIAVEGFDPRDLLSGRYIYLHLNWEKTDCKQFLNKICPREKFETAYRYYLPETDADKLEKLMLEKNPALDLTFSYSKGETPRIQNLLINGIEWENWLSRF